LGVCEEIGDHRTAVLCLEGLACVAAANDRAHTAARALGAADAERERLGTPRAPIDQARQERLYARAKRALGENTWTEAWRAGFALTVEHAAIEVRESPGANRPRKAALADDGGSTNADALTPREREVVQLVSAGNSNRQIAQQLVLSERTVESHVGNALAKLSLRSRSQLAVWAAENRLAS
jgi:DNA-binding CsgD family transcriptional regulator